MFARLIQHEDYQGNILAAIEAYFPLNKNLDVVELGAGTGRLTRLLAPRVRSIKAFDTSAHMLEVAEKSLREMGFPKEKIRFGLLLVVPDKSCDI